MYSVRTVFSQVLDFYPCTNFGDVLIDTMVARVFELLHAYTNICAWHLLNLRIAKASVILSMTGKEYRQAASLFN